MSVERIVVRRDPLGLEHLPQPVPDGAGPDAPEVEALEPREHRRRGGRDLLRLGGGEDEDHPRRRLLEHLEQRVPRLAREHVRFVDDVDLVVAFAGGGVHRPLAQVARVVDAAVAGGIDLDHVEVGRAAPDAEAVLALAAGLAVGVAIGAVERHREDPRGGRLADAAGAGQEIAVADAAPGHGAAKDGGHVVLHEQVGEAFGAVAACEGDGHGRREKKSASGSPKRHRASLSAATGEVLTRFTRRRPSDLRHQQYIPGAPRMELLSPG